MGKTSIEWTDRSVNPLRARLRSLDGDLQPIVNVGHYCEKLSPGCKNCYSSSFQPRFGMPQFQDQRGDPNIEHWLDVRKLEEVLRRRIPTKWFWCDMTDMFGDWVSFEHIATCFRVMALTPHHTHQVLTKRPKRAIEWFKWVAGQNGSEGPFHPRAVLHMAAARNGIKQGPSEWIPGPWPLPNVWLGVSTEDQRRADERIPLLLQCQAAVRFISAEPLLAPLDLRSIPANYPGAKGDMLDALSGCEWFDQDTPYGLTRPSSPAREGARLAWVIVGGESGNGARTFDIDWAFSLVRQCREAGVPCFVKQVGARPMREGVRDGGIIERFKLSDRKGGDMSEWPESLRVREFPRTA